MRLVLDIYLKGLLYIECLLVFKKLIEVFLNDLNFYVYLGCFYVYCRLNEDDEVEKCL